MIGIYKITSPSGKIYIGQSINIERRFKEHIANYSNYNFPIYKSLKKYGSENHKFEIIEECEVSELNDKERYYQDLYSSVGKNGLNCSLTKSKDRNGKHSKETRQKISLKITGRKLSESHKLKIIRTGCVLTEDHKLKIKNSNIGLKRSEETKLKMSNKKISDETRLKMSNSKKLMSKETKLKLSIALKNRIDKPKRVRLILNTESGIYYFGYDEVAHVFGHKKYTIQDRLTGKRKNNTNLIRV